MVACETGTVLDLQALPEGCIANIISFTTPPDVCRLSSVSKIFRAAAECDAFWDKFLPPDIHFVSSSSVSSIKSKKELYLSLCNNPISTGKILFPGQVERKKMLYDICKGPSDTWVSYSSFLDMDFSVRLQTSSNESKSVKLNKFGEVAELVDSLWFEITGKIVTFILSPSSLYKAYLVFKLSEQAYGFRGQPVKVKVKKSYKLNPTTVGVEANEQFVVLDREKKRSYWHRIVGMHASLPRDIDEPPYPRERADGWLEIELGEFSYERDDELLKMSCKENSGGGFKGGLIVLGIEIRPYFGERPDPRQNWKSSWARLWNKAQSYSYCVLLYYFGTMFLLIVLKELLQYAFLFSNVGVLH